MSETKSLVEQAMEVQTKRRTKSSITEQERELALAWVHGKVSISQVAVVRNVKTGGVYPFLAQALREELLKGY